MRTLRLALRLLTRDWRAGELRVLIAALVLAVGSVGTVGFFADRVKVALAEQANLLLGADLMISGDRPLPNAFASEAQRDGGRRRSGAAISADSAALLGVTPARARVNEERRSAPRSGL